MKRLLLPAIICLNAPACLGVPAQPTLPSAAIALPDSLRVQLIEHGVPTIREIPLEEARSSGRH